MSTPAGFLDTGDEFLHVMTATCRLHGHGNLDVSAEGKAVTIGIFGIAFGVGSPEQLLGREWQLDVTDGDSADTFGEVGVQIRGERLDVLAAKVTCQGLDASTRKLTLAIEFEAESEDSGRTGEYSAVLVCNVASAG